MIRRLCACLLGSASLAAAEPFSLDFPVDCTLGETCYIQQYVDHDPGPGARDFTCQGLSYDGHKGTDIALPTLAAMAQGVRVRAAAPGIPIRCHFHDTRTPRRGGRPAARRP